MNRVVTAFLASILLAPSANAAPIIGAYFDNKVNVYVDLEEVKRVGNFAGAWVAHQYFSPVSTEKNTYETLHILYKYDCTAGKSQLARYTMSLNGRLVSEADNPDKTWTQESPTALGGKILNLACTGEVFEGFTRHETQAEFDAEHQKIKDLLGIK